MKNTELADQVTEYLLTCDDSAIFKLNVTTLAGLFHVDRSHLARQFKASKHFTLCGFLQKEKMGRAASLLSSSSKLTMERLSQKMGFCASEYFREVFKRHFGVVPSTLFRNDVLADDFVFEFDPQSVRHAGPHAGGFISRTKPEGSPS